MAFRQISLAPKFIVSDFPPCFLPETEAAAALRQALIDLGETRCAVTEPRVDERLPKELALMQNYPNPVSAAQHFFLRGLFINRRNARTRFRERRLFVLI